jgi:hypothetical protein
MLFASFSGKRSILLDQLVPLELIRNQVFREAEQRFLLLFLEKEEIYNAWLASACGQSIQHNLRLQLIE